MKDAWGPSKLFIWVNLGTVIAFIYFSLHRLGTCLFFSKVEHHECFGTLLHIFFMRRGSISEAGIVSKRYPSLSNLVKSLLLK
jgi:hypothetical protein